MISKIENIYKENFSGRTVIKKKTAYYLFRIIPIFIKYEYYK